MKFEEIEFYDYKIRMCVDNGIRMYLVSDLLRQYNEKHGTNKLFKNYLQNKQTQELIEHMAKSVGWNSSLRSEGGQEGQNSEKTGRENSPVQRRDSIHHDIIVCRYKQGLHHLRGVASCLPHVGRSCICLRCA